jgi:galactoside O-acetyltransferase
MALSLPTFAQGHQRGAIIVEDGVWIAANAVITRDVTLGEGCVVGAGAIVTRDVPPFAIVGGNPAAVIGQRR